MVVAPVFAPKRPLRARRDAFFKRMSGLSKDKLLRLARGLCLGSSSVEVSDAEMTIEYRASAEIMTNPVARGQ